LALTQEETPWKGLEFEIAEEAKELFWSCTKLEVGNGQRLQFWSVRWLNGTIVQELAPNLMKFVRPGSRTMTVVVAMHGISWVT
jgi:hypothetical protein